MLDILWHCENDHTFSEHFVVRVLASFPKSNFMLAVVVMFAILQYIACRYKFTAPFFLKRFC